MGIIHNISMGVNSDIIDFSHLYKFDLDLIGKKGYQLGELKHLGIPIPDGFVITTSFSKEFLQETGLDVKIKKLEKLMHPAIASSREKLFEPIKKEIIQTHVPQHLASRLQKFYRKLSLLFKEPSLNIYSSTKDNQSIVFYDVKGDANLFLKIKTIWGFYLGKPVAIVLQKNIDSKIKGTIVTNNPTKELKHIAYKIQKHFYFPQELNYVVQKSKIYVTQVKPFTGIVDTFPKEPPQIKKTEKVLVKGISLNPGIVTGPVKLINNQNFAAVKNSEIVVIKNINKSLYNKIKKAKAVVIDAALQVPIDKFHYRKIIKAPTIINTQNATKLLQNGNIITVNGTSAEIYSGGLI